MSEGQSIRSHSAPPSPNDPLRRTKLRPSLDEWRDEEPITLAEAAALFFPHGPLTIASFRRLEASGKLAVTRLAGKDFTTPSAVKEMLRPCQDQSQSRRASISEGTSKRGSSSIVQNRSAQDAAASKLTQQRKRSPIISVDASAPPSANVIPRGLR